VFRETLPDMVRAYLLVADPDKGRPERLPLQAAEIREQLRSLGDPTRMYQGQLPLFPAVYRLELTFHLPGGLSLPPAVWEAGGPRRRHTRQARRLDHSLLGPSDGRAVLQFEYQLHAYNKRQRDEQAAGVRLRWVSALAVAATLLALLWACS